MFSDATFCEDVKFVGTDWLGAVGLSAIGVNCCVDDCFF